VSDFANDLFADLNPEANKSEEFFPGSKRKRSDPPPPKPPVTTVAWDRRPRVLPVGGKPVEFFTIGDLALAINRRPVTIRSWEAKGIMPKARFRTPAVPGQIGEGKRLYTRRQVEGLVVLCAKHGILDFAARPDSIPKAFTDDVKALWAEAPA
jgi:hypothetical protein